jgi:hypothetical protein
LFVAQNPDWDSTAYDSTLTAEYGSFASIGDVLRQIGHDERTHKLSSLESMQQRRFR